MSMSRAWSATILFRRWFSFSNSLSFLAVVGLHAPYWFSQRYQVAGVTSKWRATSSTDLPSARSFLAFVQLADDLVRRVLASLHVGVPPCPNHGHRLTSEVDHSQGVGSGPPQEHQPEWLGACRRRRRPSSTTTRGDYDKWCIMTLMHHSCKASRSPGSAGREKVLRLWWPWARDNGRAFFVAAASAHDHRRAQVFDETPVRRVHSAEMSGRTAAK